jgi:hypothetical protein
MGNSVQNFFTSRDNNTDPATYVGQLDRLWYNPDTNQIFVSDGTTPGGQPVDLGANANALINTLTVSTITSTSGTVNLTGNISITGNISPATETKIGGVKAGPGANISNDGTLTIDTAGLPLSFGDFTANLNILTLVNEDQNMILATKGSAEVQLIGNVGFYKTDGFPPNVANRYFRADDDGQVQFLVSNTDPLLGAVEIVGSSSGNSIAPGITGAMLHVTGQLDIPCRLYYDGNGDYVSWVARRWNGNVATPTQVLAGEDILRINATAATEAGVGNVATVQISATALENQTTTAQGSSITFTVTPVGSAASARVDVANVTVANGVTATKFTTAGTVIATGNISGGNVLTGGLISATGNITAGNVAATNYAGLVTHAVREAGDVSGGTVTLNMTTDDIVRCSFANQNMTVAFSNIIPGRIVTLLAQKTDGGTDTISTGVTTQNISTGDATVDVDGLSTAVLTYYSLGTTTGNIYCSINFRP